MRHDCIHKVWESAQDFYGFKEIMVFMVVAVEDGRNNRDLLHHEGVVQGDWAPEHAEFEQSATWAGGLHTGIKGLLGAHGIEGHVVVAAGFRNGMSTDLLRGD